MVGGSANGQVLVARDAYVLTVVVPRPSRATIWISTETYATEPLAVSQEVYEAATIWVFDRTYRTWRTREQSEETHVREAILALISLNDTDRVRVLDTGDGRL